MVSIAMASGRRQLILPILLIYTCERCGADLFDYLVELQKHAAELAGNPGAWMPWNYRETIDRGQASISSN